MKPAQMSAGERPRRKHPLDMTVEERQAKLRREFDEAAARVAKHGPVAPGTPIEEDRWARERLLFPYDERLPDPNFEPGL